MPGALGCLLPLTVVGWGEGGAPMKLHERFEWDRTKAAANRKKHGVTFDHAGAVLSDEWGDAYHLEEHDDEHSMGEDRTITIGSHPLDRNIVLRICWTIRSTGAGCTTRIISARRADHRERAAYEKFIKGR
jgi:uncharacterized DUF497 family protein